MRNPLSKTIVTIKLSGIRKFFDLVNEMEGVISLGVGEPDFDTPWHIRDEGIYALEKGKTFYTSNSGLTELRQEIANYIKRTQGVTYDPKKEIMVTVGGSEAIDVAFRAMLDPEDEVLIPEPSYVSYVPCAVLAGGKPVIIDLKAGNDFRLTAEEVIEKITEKTKILVLPFPNNPTGSVMGKEELEKIAKVVIEKDIFVLSDEIYAELTYNGKHVSITSIEGMRERTVLINGFSKAYAMTGWRLGYACAPEVILKQMLKIHQYAIMCAPTTSQYAAVEALKNGDKDVEEMRRSYNHRRRFLMNAFKLSLHVLSKLKVKRAQRLIEQKDLWIIRKRPGYCNPLLLPARKEINVTIYVSFKVNHPEHFFNLFPDFFLRLFLNSQPESHVFINVKMREKCIFLENRVHFAFVRGNIINVFPFKKQIAAVRLQKAGNYPQSCGFAAT